ncbi:MAG: cation-transporting P-type ATPase [Gammaproteobacteria bacterium]|nr:cation-transporting P-type ATPase [Gammaproteobacteria bacterium]
MQSEPTIWHAITVDELWQATASQPQGLAASEVALRLQRDGENRLPEAPPRSALMRFLLQFHNVLIYALIVAALVTLALQHWLDASVIIGVVVINAFIGFIQEGKAEDALRAIRQMLSQHAVVLRDGRQQRVEAAQLVVGDIVLLQPGDKVPADLRIVACKGIAAQEAVLTGESLAVEKQTASVAATALLGDRRCMLYSGTMITRGQGRGVVIATAAQTEIGRISSLVANVDSVVTPLLRQMNEFSRWLTAAIIAVALLTFAVGIWRGYSASDMFLAVVSLAVAAIPEGLPAIMTITLAIGVQRMAARNAIIRRLPAVETLGAVTVICSDKTGTLTRNEMTLSHMVTATEGYSVSGSGYDPHGEISTATGAKAGSADAALPLLLRAIVLCNDAALEQSPQGWQVNGDPMEGALLVAGVKGGLEQHLEQQRYPRTDLIPFESQHRFMATLHHSHSGEAYILVKGAPEELLKRCQQQWQGEQPQPLDLPFWQQQIALLAARGERVLAVATRAVAHEQRELTFADVADDLILLGLLALIDPPREEAIVAVASCRKAGIRVKMITGDHALTARAIAAQLQLDNSQDVLTGLEIEAMDRTLLQQRVVATDVFARVSPEHKLLLVELLQAQGEVVAMTGDGVNDAPALKRADVGTAMGRGGTEAAKEAAEMVLADDNFASITHAVEEGRTVYDNLKKAIIFILPTNGGEALLVLAAILFGYSDLPLTPVQILWVNMITAVTLALALAFEPAEPGLMRRAPRQSSEPMINRYLIGRTLYVSLILVAGTFGLFLWQREGGASLEYARTVAVNTLVLFEIFYLFNARYLSAPVLNWQGLTGNRYVLIAIAILLIFQLLFTYWQPLQLLFGTVAISTETWLQMVLLTSTVLFLVEAEKWIKRSFR